MKPRFSNQQNHALTLVEVLVVITVLAILAAIFLPAIAAYKVRKLKIRNGCVNNLREISLAYRVWEGDHGDKYPMFVFVTNGGAMELIATGNVAACFQVMSNELSTPIILTCPEDKKRLPAATNFFDIQLKDKISYFIGVDAKESQPQMFLSGDDNLAVDGIPPKSGLLELSTNSTIEWTTKRHDRIGNIGLADGSVWQGTSSALCQLLRDSGIATNRLALP
jgi:prepilin-type N-terminal cleavage/methylation domain-containing protein